MQIRKTQSGVAAENAGDAVMEIFEAAGFSGALRPA